MSRIYHITSKFEVQASREIGEYRAESLDNVGFIHFSTAQQVIGTANAFYSGQRGLVLLVVDPSRLNKELRWETPAHPLPQPDSSTNIQLFPHLYGPLNLDAVTDVIDFEPNPDGKFALPSKLVFPEP